MGDLLREGALLEGTLGKGISLACIGSPPSQRTQEQGMADRPMTEPIQDLCGTSICAHCLWGDFCTAVRHCDSLRPLSVSQASATKMGTTLRSRCVHVHITWPLSVQVTPFGSNDGACVHVLCAVIGALVTQTSHAAVDQLMLTTGTPTANKFY